MVGWLSEILPLRWNTWNNNRYIEEDCYAIHGANSKEEAIEIWNNRVEHLKELDQQKGCKKIFEEIQKNQLR